MSKVKGPIFDPGLCRCCGFLKKCRLLNVEYESLGHKETYSDMIMDCFGLLLSNLDGKPTERLVCATCVVRLREANCFRAQVLRCEEAFLQLRMSEADADNKCNGDIREDTETQMLVEVKPEPPDCGSPPCDIPLPDVDDYDSSDSVPLSQRNGLKTVKLKKSKRKAHKRKSTVSSVLEDSSKIPLGVKSELDAATLHDAVKLIHFAEDRPVTESSRAVTSTQGTSMTKLQQRMREKDPTYVTETNILTLVEYSYVVPFKCRHNILLCYYCGQNFTLPDELRIHTEKCHHPKKFKIVEFQKMVKIDITKVDCRLCDAKIENIELFKEHITKVHEKKYYFNFKETVLPFRLDSDLKCVFCDEKFPYFHAINKHMNKHFSNYVCDQCGLGFVDYRRFAMHQQRHEEADYPCETCGKVFKALYNKDLHVDRVHNKRGRVYCPKCDVKLMTYQQKLKHLMEVHGDEPLSFSCDECDRVFCTRRTLTLHRRKDHLKDFRFECQYCGQRFFTRSALTNHVPTHTGERNFKCKVCEKSYPRIKTLRDHMRIHTNDRRYRCHVCGQAFIQNCSLKGHMKSQHPEYG